MPRRRRERVLHLTMWAIVLAVPLLASLVASYALTLKSARTDLELMAEANARRVATIFAQGAETLAGLAAATSGRCDETDLEALRQVVYRGLYFREAGLLRSGELHCTSFQRYQPPVRIPADYLVDRAVYADGPFEIWLPQPTLLGGQSLVVVRFVDRARIDYVNLLLNLQQFADGVTHFGDVEGWAVLSTPSGPRSLVAEDTALPGWLPEHLPAGSARDVEGGMLAIAQAAPFPVHVIARLPAHAVRARWAAQARPAALVGFVLTLAAGLLLRRLLPMEYDERRDLRTALRRGEIEAHLQPLIDARSGRVVGAEALARWRHPQRGWISPERFVGLAERTDQLEPLTAAILAAVHTARRRLSPELRLAINLSPPLLRGGRLERLLDAEFGPRARLDGLVFEITERQLIEYSGGEAAQCVARLAERGAWIGLDDFGTGYSGLSHLRHLPLHELKIDGSFVRALDTEAVTSSLIDGIVVMAGRLGLELVAEGVETLAQRRLLLARGIRIQQGWLYSPALPLGEFEEFLANYRDEAGAA